MRNKLNTISATKHIFIHFMTWKSYKYTSTEEDAAGAF